jgi:2-iminobutanoate/2-iminopropanoate deaminase
MLDQLFSNIEACLVEAGGSLDNLALATIFLSDLRFREQLNNTWLRLFPNVDNRPARNTVQRPMGNGEIVWCEFTAVLGGQNRRRVLSIPGVAEVHNPAPTAVVVGNYVYCVRVSGQEPGSGHLPEAPQRQIEQLFANVRALLEQAGGTLDDLAYITVALAAGEGEGLQNVAHREILNDVWLRHFPNAGDRPARHTIPAPMREGQLISASFAGILGRI